MLHACLSPPEAYELHDRAPLRPPLRRPVLRSRPARAGDQRDQRSEARHRRLLRRPDDVRLQARVRGGEALPGQGRVRVDGRDPGQPRLAERRLRPLRGAVRRPQLRAARGPGHRRRGRFDRARPRSRPDRPRPLPLDRGAVRSGREPADLRLSPPPAAGARHRARAERDLRRGRHDRDASSVPASTSCSRATSTFPTPGSSRTSSSSTRAPSRRCGSGATRGPVTTSSRCREAMSPSGASTPSTARSGSSSSRSTRSSTRSTRAGSRTR